MKQFIKKISAVILSGLTVFTLCAGGYHLKAEGEQPIGDQPMPAGFITSLKICKSINDGNCIEFGDEEIERNSKMNLFFEYEIPNDNIEPDVTYTFDIAGDFKAAVSFTIYSDRIIDNKGIAAKGMVEGNTVELTFTQDAKDAELLQVDNTGIFWFGASFDGDKIANKGKQEFEATAQGINTKSELNFAVTPIEADVKLVKEGILDLDKKEITWTINVDPSMKNAPIDKQQFETITITDKLPDKLAYIESKSFAPDAASIAYNDGSVSVTYNNLDVNSNPTITIVTSFDPTVEGFLTENKAIFNNKATAEYTYPQIKKDDDPTSSTYNQAIDADLGTGTAESNEKVVEIVGSSLDKTGSLLNGNAMQWEIKVQNSLGLDNPIIKDTLPTDTALVNGTLFIGSTPINQGGSTLPYYELNGRDLTIHLDNKTSEQIITYKTEFTADWNDKHTDGKVVNTAEFYGGSGQESLIEKEAIVQLGGQLLTKNGTYDASDHTITWKVDVKNTGNGLMNIVLTDTIPKGQELVGNEKSVTALGSSSVKYDDSINTLTITYADKYNDWDNQTPDIEYKTILTDDQKDLWGNNTTGKNAENAIAISADGLPSKNLSVTGYAPIVSKVLKKDYVGYSFTEKQVTWNLTVNENQMELNNAKIDDTLPEGWKFVEDSVEIKQDGKKITNYTKLFTDKDMHLELPKMNKGDKPYVVTYKAQLIDEKLLATNNEIIAENEAVLKGDEIVDGGVKVKGSHKIAQSVIEKKGDNKNFSKEGYLSWEILVNCNLAELNAQSGKNVIVVDEINEKLMPVMDSIKVYKLKLNANGKETDAALLKENEYLVNYAVSTKTLSIDFKTKVLKDAYRIIFNTDVLESGSYTNSAHFDGMPTDHMSASSQSINAHFSGGNTTTAYGDVEVEITNDKDESLNDVEFSIYKLNSKTPLYAHLTINDLSSL